MNAPTLAKDFMITRLVTLSPEMDVFDAVDLLLRHRISGAPVVDSDGRYLGVFSEGSCMSVLVKAAYEQLPTTEVVAFTAADAQTIDEDTDLLTIVQLFHNTAARRLPVVRDGQLVGQISRRDVLQAAQRLIDVSPNRDAALLYLSSLVARDEAPIA